MPVYWVISPVIGPSCLFPERPLLRVISRDLRDVEERCASCQPSGAMWRLRLHAANDAIVAGIMQRDAAVLQRRDNHFIVVHGRYAKSQTEARRRDRELIQRALPDANRERGLRQTHVGRGFPCTCRLTGWWHHGRLPSTADAQVLEHGVAARNLGRNLIARFC